MESKTSDFKAIMLKLASPDVITSWSFGEVTKPETINYRTQRPEKDGLFDERIFGPEKDYECYCGKYRRVRYKGIICDKCGVEVTRSIVRRERMGHIKLASPVSHIWFLRGVPSRLGLVLDLSISDLERATYFGGYIITKINEDARQQTLNNLEKEFKAKTKAAISKKDKAALKDAFNATRSDIESIILRRVLSETEYHRLSLKFGDIFEAGIGAEALHQLCSDINLKELRDELEKKFDGLSAQDKKKTIKRLSLIKAMIKSGVRPEWMFITVIPVIPPALRPMVQLDGGRHATSDVNDLYRRVINRNNRLKKLLDLKAPEVIVRNEKRMLQESVDALIDNSIRRGQTSVVRSQAQKRPLRSLADMLKGKQGRFRQNLLGKRVDYSARSVIVVGPDLKLHQCGLPKHMALELFRPFVIAKLIEQELAHNIKGAGRLVDEPTDEVWSMLEKIIENRYVLLNRAPTLHRLGVQAFQPVLIEGDAIQIHPLVCQAFNADFDGDQMAVHVPLTEAAQAEARDIMLATKNLTKPGTGEPSVNHTQDMVLGCYWLTKIRSGAKGEGKIFASPNDAILAYEFGQVNLQALIKFRPTKTPKYQKEKQDLIETSVGRLLFNSVLPDDFEFINDEIKKKTLQNIIVRLIDKYGVEKLPGILDKIKTFGFQYATKSGISWGIDDLVVPQGKEVLIAQAMEQAGNVQKQYEDGLLTDEERYRRVVEIWSEVKQKVDSIVPGALEELGSVHSMVSSAARGNWTQVSQMTGMKGPVRNPAGRIIEVPITSSYKEGLKVLEYFISTHGARKGTADTALKTSAAGYLTRRLVDVAQDVIILEEDCKTSDGIKFLRSEVVDRGKNLSNVLFGRVLAEGLKDKSGKIIFKKGHLLNLKDSDVVQESDVEKVSVRSPITCKTIRGLCRTCYGYDLGNNERIKIGEAAGIVAAQAIGEPGTQLTMRTFHTGGVAVGGDITLGLPRVEELFESRIPKNPAILSEVAGEILEIKEEGRDKIVKILVDDSSDLTFDLKVKKTKVKKKEKESKEYLVPFGRSLVIEEGNFVKPGTPLSDGPIDIRELFRLAGQQVCQNYILNEVNKVYTFQGSSINDKHVEVIIRQMFSRVKISDSGSTLFAIGDVVEYTDFIEQNKEIEGEGGKPAKATSLLLGISRVALTTSSFLSAASFQETARVLISSAIEGKIDRLRGLKENVIIGHLIPAGTNFRGEYMSEEDEENIDFE